MRRRVESPYRQIQQDKLCKAIRKNRKVNSKGKTMKQKSTPNMKLIATAALMLNFSVAGIHAETVSVDLSVSGTAANSTVQTTPGTPASEYNLAGGGILDPFTFRVVSTSAAN